ncbi:hypothetical protein [Ruminococcus albus]|nr:hypothetical protein [Ruminococcus albus]
MKSEQFCGQMMIYRGVSEADVTVRESVIWNSMSFTKMMLTV